MSTKVYEFELMGIKSKDQLATIRPLKLKQYDWQVLLVRCATVDHRSQAFLTMKGGPIRF